MYVPSMYEGLFGDLERIPNAAEVNRIKEENNFKYYKSLKEEYAEQIVFAAQAGLNYCFVDLPITKEIKDELIDGGYRVTPCKIDGQISFYIEW